MNPSYSLLAANTMPVSSGNKRQVADNAVERLSMVAPPPTKRFKQPSAFIELDFTRLAALSDQSHATRQVILQQWDTMSPVPTTAAWMPAQPSPRRSHTPVLSQEQEAVPLAANTTTPAPTIPAVLVPFDTTVLTTTTPQRGSEGQNKSQKNAEKESSSKDLPETRLAFSFEEFLKAFLGFRKQFNHVHIPEAYVDDDTGIPLGSWVRKLRQDYRRQQQQMKKKSGKAHKTSGDAAAMLNEHRIAILNELGMDWKPLPPIRKKISTGEAVQELMSRRQEDAWNASFVQWLHADALSRHDARICDTWAQDQREDLTLDQEGSPGYDRLLRLFRGILLESCTDFTNTKYRL
jgi:hypothetical protein